ncbi:hypothetical protein M011DRAFT_482842 [Sporormia fimetaria CBS 119925]|uniref:Uncharacterized protein n=1 Tax=Sporormia fimetaria CBS 119925 TaxID=1340428 RepID=A0A6A6VQL2_9PLEO|nr:hypothetical protein M011DRAFT_482842 [Sporormia fimetaria CBS 119925]
MLFEAATLALGLLHGAEAQIFLNTTASDLAYNEQPCGDPISRSVGFAFCYFISYTYLVFDGSTFTITPAYDITRCRPFIFFDPSWNRVELDSFVNRRAIFFIAGAAVSTTQAINIVVIDAYKTSTSAAIAQHNRGVSHRYASSTPSNELCSSTHSVIEHHSCSPIPDTAPSHLDWSSIASKRLDSTTLPGFEHHALRSSSPTSTNRLRHTHRANLETLTDYHPTPHTNATYANTIKLNQTSYIYRRRVVYARASDTYAPSTNVVDISSIYDVFASTNAHDFPTPSYNADNTDSGNSYAETLAYEEDDGKWWGDDDEEDEDSEWWGDDDDEEADSGWWENDDEDDEDDSGWWSRFGRGGWGRGSRGRRTGWWGRKSLKRDEVGARPVEGRPVGARPVGPRPVEGRPVEGRPVEGRPVEGRPGEGRPVEGIE